MKNKKNLIHGESQEMTISGLDYEASKDLVDEINKELADDWSVEKKLVFWNSQDSIFISKNSLFFELINLRIKKKLHDIVQKERITIWVN